MKPVSQSLSLRSLVSSRLPLRLLPSTNSLYSRPSLLHSFTSSYSTLNIMSQPPKRKFRPRGDRSGGGAGRGGMQQTTMRSNVTQQPKRPKVEESLPASEGAMDLKQMYSTSAGVGEPKPWSEMNGKLDKSLLNNLDKMGFE